MRWLDQGKLRLRTLFQRQQVERELGAEFEFHVEQQTAENLAAGMSLNEARYAALRSTGAITQLQEQCRDHRGLHLIETTLQDIRYAVRSLRKSPGFTAVAVTSLALGMGANAAIFSLIDSFLLSSLRVKDPQQLVFVRTNREKFGNFQVSRTILYRDIEPMRKQATQLAGIASFQSDERLSVAVSGHSELASGDFVSGNYFEVLGVPSQIGRTIIPADDRESGSTSDGWAAMISDGYWQRRFGRDPGVVGQRITINTIPFVILGVMQPDFAGLSLEEPADVVMPVITHAQVASGSLSAGFPKPEDSPGQMVARIGNRVSPSKAAAELSVIFRNVELAEAKLSQAEQKAISERSIEFDSAAHGSSYLRQRFSEPLEVLMVVVVLVMLIACANIATLLLAKASVRQKEIAIRLSLGSSRPRIVRQLLTECMILAIWGCLLGIAFAIFAREVTLQLSAGSSGQVLGLGMPWDFRLIGFLAGVCVLNAMLFGIVPALRTTNVDPNEVLKNAQSNNKTARLPFGRTLIASQLALSLTLIAGSGLFLVTLRNLYDIDLGFNTENMLIASLDPGLIGFGGPRIRSTYERLLRDLQNLPSVHSASLMNDPLLTGKAHLSDVKVPGYVPKSEEERSNRWTLAYDVGPRYFETVGMSLIAGRDFTEADNDHEPVVIVNEEFAKHYFGERNPIGQKLWLSSTFKSQKAGEKGEAEVVGIAHNAHYFSVQDEHQEGIFVPAFQLRDDQLDSRQTVVVRTRQKPEQVANDVRAVVRRIDPNIPLFDVRSMKIQLDRSLSRQRLMAVLSSFFGFLALALSAIGLYGVLAYGVNKRTGEIGIRMALGATRNTILKLVLGETARLLAIGVSAGLALAWACSRLAKSLLYGLSPHDGRVFALAALLLIVVAMVAAFLPARRAVRVDPMVALRYE